MYTSIFKHPTLPGRCIEMNETGIVSEYDIETGSNMKIYNRKFEGANEFPDACVLDDNEGGFMMICKYKEQPWRLFRSKTDKWEDLEEWENSGNISSKFLCHVPQHNCFYYAVNGSYELRKVSLQRSSIAFINNLVSP